MPQLCNAGLRAGLPAPAHLAASTVPVICAPQQGEGWSEVTNHGVHSTLERRFSVVGHRSWGRKRPKSPTDGDS